MCHSRMHTSFPSLHVSSALVYSFRTEFNKVVSWLAPHKWNTEAEYHCGLVVMQISGLLPMPRGGVPRGHLKSESKPSNLEALGAPLETLRLCEDSEK